MVSFVYLHSASSYTQPHRERKRPGKASFGGKKSLSSLLLWGEDRPKKHHSRSSRLIHILINLVLGFRSACSIMWPVQYLPWNNTPPCVFRIQARRLSSYRRTLRLRIAFPSVFFFFFRKVERSPFENTAWLRRIERTVTPIRWFNTIYLFRKKVDQVLSFEHASVFPVDGSRLNLPASSRLPLINVCNIAGEETGCHPPTNSSQFAKLPLLLESSATWVAFRSCSVASYLEFLSDKTDYKPWQPSRFCCCCRCRFFPVNFRTRRHMFPRGPLAGFKSITFALCLSSKRNLSELSTKKKSDMAKPGTNGGKNRRWSISIRETPKRVLWNCRIFFGYFSLSSKHENKKYRRDSKPTDEEP